MPKYDKDGREYIQQDGKKYYRDMFGGWKAETDIFGNEKVETDWLGNPKIETDIFGNQKIESDWFGNPYVEPKKDDDSGEGCFLTTACMAALREKFDDNCRELETLRTFRDTYVKKFHPADIDSYYNRAPKIVDAINVREDRHKIYIDIYDHLIVKAIQLISHNALEEAYVLYKKFVVSLEQEYLLPTIV